MPPKPKTPSESVAVGWACEWTGIGARLLLDVFTGAVATPTSLKLAACVGKPVFDESDEVDATAMSEVEFAESAPEPLGITAPGYEQATLTLDGDFAAASSFAEAGTASGHSATFGSNGNTSDSDWPLCTHVVVLNGTDAIAVITLDPAGQLALPSGLKLRVPAEAFSIIASTGVITA